MTAADDRREARRRSEDGLFAGGMTPEDRARLVDEIAERVSERAFEKFKQEVGGSVIRNLLWLLALGAAALVALWKVKPSELP